MTPAQAAAAAQGALARGDWAGAVDALRILALADPRNASIRYNLGLALRRLGRDREALAALAGTLELAPGHLNARFEHAACLMDLGRIGAAEEAFAAYCDAVPDDADGWLNLGRLRLRRGDGDGALAALDRLRALRPDDPEAATAHAEALSLVDREAGHAALRALCARNPRDRPRLLKAMTQGPRGRLPLSARALGGTEAGDPA